MTRLRPDLGADPLDLLFDHGGRRPGGRRAGDVVEEVLEQILAVRRVHDLRMELDAVEPSLHVLERSDRRRRRRARDHRPLWWRDDGVAVAHPDNLLLRETREQRAATAVELGLTELGRPGARDLAAQLEREQLRAVADAERRDPELEQRLVDPRRSVGIHRRRAAGEDQRRRVAPAHLLHVERVRDKLRVDARVANSPCDQLRVLPAEVEHEDRTLLGDRLRGRQRMDGAHATAAGSSAIPS